MLHHTTLSQSILHIPYNTLHCSSFFYTVLLLCAFHKQLTSIPATYGPPPPPPETMFIQLLSAQQPQPPPYYVQQQYPSTTNPQQQMMYVGVHQAPLTTIKF